MFLSKRKYLLLAISVCWLVTVKRLELLLLIRNGGSKFRIHGLELLAFYCHVSNFARCFIINDSLTYEALFHYHMKLPYFIVGVILGLTVAFWCCLVRPIRTTRPCE